MRKNTIHNTKGAVALITILIISSILIISAIGSAEIQLATSFQGQNNMSEKITLYSAEACLEESLHRLELDSSFNSETLAIGDVNCNISIAGAVTKTISITATYGNYSQDFTGSATVTAVGEANNVSLLDWKQI